MMSHKKVVKCEIINSKNEILLIQRAPHDTHSGYWETPGGGVDSDEHPDDACIREVLEETGIDLSAHHVVIKLDEVTTMKDDESGEEYSVYLYSCKVNLMNDSVDLSKNPDHVGFIWIEKSNIRNIKIDSWTESQISTRYPEEFSYIKFIFL